MIKIIKSRIYLMALAASLGAPCTAATSRSNQSIQDIQADSRPCLFFNLAGVSEADPAVPAQIWFTIPTSNANYQTQASIILSSKVAGKPLRVQTDGTVSCGYATASVIGF